MKNFRPGLAIAFMLILASVTVVQAESKTEQMMEEVMHKAKDITSYEVDMRVDTHMMGKKMSTEGHMVFKKPDKMHMTSTSNMMPGMKQEVISSGDVMWTYMPMMNMATKLDMSKVKDQAPEHGRMPNTSDITKPFEGFPKNGIKYIEKKTVDGEETYVFEALLHKFGQMPQGQASPQMLPNKMVFWINADTGLPNKVLMLGEDDAVMMEQTYSNFKLNIPIDDSEFEFTPPEGVQVVDMTEASMNMMKQMQQGQQMPHE